MKIYDAQKAKGLLIKLKYQKFQASILKRDLLIKKKPNDMMCMKPNEKFQNYVIKFIWEVIYAYLYILSIYY